MGRKAVLHPYQINEIREKYEAGAKVKDLSLYYGVSTILIYRVLNKKGAYRVDPVILGTPIMDANGQIVNVIPHPTEG